MTHSIEHADNQQLLELAKLITGEPPRQAVTTEYIDAIQFHGIGALVYEYNSDSALLEALGTQKPLMAAAEALRLNELKRLFEAFRRATLSRYIVFKGTALAYTVYPKPWLRPRSDTDILIERSQLDQFAAVFATLGYQRQFGISGELVSYQCTFGKHLPGNATINIDVHWCISNRQCIAKAVSFDDIFTDALSLEALSKNTPVPAPYDALILACAHRLGHHHTEERLAWLYDIHLLAESLNEDQWQHFKRRSMAWKLSLLCADGISESQRIFATDTPKALLDDLTNIDPINQPSHIFLQRELPAWKIFISDIQSLSTLGQRWRFVMETAFPSPTYIRQKMSTSSALWGYILRACRGVKRLFKT